MQEPLYLRVKQWDCQSDCRYHCMLAREEERATLGGKPVKYHGKWPFLRVYGIQEPVSVALSALNLSVQFHGWLSFFILLYCKLPSRPDRKTYYEYTGSWHTYGIFSINSWFWSAVFHSWDVELTEKLDYSSAVALLGFFLILAFTKSFERVTRHPSRWKLWVVVVGGGLDLLLEIYDFPPYMGFVDAHALWHATTVPLLTSGGASSEMMLS
ncbi:hypothetical protein NL676_016392 [Syzygium grande]|nr:hypothetical protein NL676_016392 [Syzygium grande]